ncbi:uncharacterized protein BCR38DRAFT_427676 [Pseudomassariella vexata]|uniref:Phosphoribosylaminoimidazole-succinocarboxamide synthase n=1 Tax=Pseudomassariella vexata TaxID=1141098 RepID=A0A1Y2E7R7_9PEZI|nr:uncharacterized protein BCR38DRAFT_427676 [Pseudomassariella vexata]ORY67608.1 hypothetical protein BCR38DRAFT_427676 [Pseudomassariella vexata]
MSESQLIHYMCSGIYSTQRTPHTPNTTPPTIASQVTVLHAPPLQIQGERAQSSASAPQAFISQATSPADAPSPPSTPSESEIYGPDRLFNHQRAVTHHVHGPLSTRPFDHSNQEKNYSARLPSNIGAMDFKDDLIREVEASVTPGIDKGPYIQYALDVLTERREGQEGRGDSKNPSSSSDEPNPMYRFMPNATPGLFQAPPAPVSIPVHTESTPYQSLLPIQRSDCQPPLVPGHGRFYSEPVPTEGNPENQDEISPEAELAARRQRRARSMSGDQGSIRLPAPYTFLPPKTEKPQDSWYNMSEWLPRRLKDPAPSSKPLNPEKYPRAMDCWQSFRPGVDPQPEFGKLQPQPLTFKPWILRVPSLLLLAFLCTLMIGALLFCAVYSSRRNGLTAFTTIYSGDYFVFRILPQLLAAVLLIYAQCIIITAFRVLPFSAMASDDIPHRRNVGFLPLYPKSFLWPQLVSTWHFWIPVIVTWILNITIPLQSSLFTVVLVNGTWRWSTVQGVAWILVFTYVLLLLSIGVLILFWHNRRTGMRRNWDLRSLADIIFLLSQSNSLQPYQGTETVASRTSMRHMLKGNNERLGWWYASGAVPFENWYGIGVPTDEQKVDIEKLGPPVHEKDRRGEAQAADLGATPNCSSVRHRYLPWCLRNGQVTMWVVAMSIVLIALFVVSFNPSTDLRHGFLPGLSAAPVTGDFSAADFVYSFVPSLLGLVLFLMFQSLDFTLRVLTPWGELSQDRGATARKSLLVDYAACYPLEVTWKAARNGHWRVAFMSLLSTMFVLLPVVAGGLFMALTPPSGIVHMYPNVPALAFVLTLLVLFLLGVVSLVPKRDQFRLPHAVTCLAEIISFCSNEELRTDEAFLFAPDKMALKGRLGAYSDREDRWCFGTGRNRQERLGIKRYNKYTLEKKRWGAENRRNRGVSDDGVLRSLRNAAAALKFAQREESGFAPYNADNISRPVVQGSSSMMR